jgi:hypothetical protein
MENELPPMHKDAQIAHLIGDMEPGSIWIRWIMSEDELTFGGYVRRYFPEFLKEVLEKPKTDEDRYVEAAERDRVRAETFLIKMENELLQYGPDKDLEWFIEYVWAKI